MQSCGSVVKLLHSRVFAETHTQPNTHTHTQRLYNTVFDIVLTPLAGNDIQPSSAVAVLVSITVSAEQKHNDRQTDRQTQAERQVNRRTGEQVHHDSASTSTVTSGCCASGPQWCTSVTAYSAAPAVAVIETLNKWPSFSTSVWSKTRINVKVK